MRFDGQSESGHGRRTGHRPGHRGSSGGQRQPSRLHRPRSGRDGSTRPHDPPGRRGCAWMSPAPTRSTPVIGKVVAEFGRLDILVNNAGVNTLAHRVTIDQFPREEWDRLLERRSDGRLRGEPGRRAGDAQPGSRAHHQHRVDCRPGAVAPAMCASWRPRPGS